MLPNLWTLRALDHAGVETELTFDASRLAAIYSYTPSLTEDRCAIVTFREGRWLVAPNAEMPDPYTYLTDCWRRGVTPTRNF